MTLEFRTLLTFSYYILCILMCSCYNGVPSFSLPQSVWVLSSPQNGSTASFPHQRITNKGECLGSIYYDDTVIILNTYAEHNDKVTYMIMNGIPYIYRNSDRSTVSSILSILNYDIDNMIFKSPYKTFKTNRSFREYSWDVLSSTQNDLIDISIGVQYYFESKGILPDSINDLHSDYSSKTDCWGNQYVYELKSYNGKHDPTDLRKMMLHLS